MSESDSLTDEELCLACLERLDFMSMAQHMVEAFSDYSWERWVEDGEAQQAAAACREAFQPQITTISPSDQPAQPEARS